MDVYSRCSVTLPSSVAFKIGLLCEHDTLVRRTVDDMLEACQEDESQVRREVCFARSAPTSYVDRLLSFTHSCVVRLVELVESQYGSVSPGSVNESGYCDSRTQVGVADSSPARTTAHRSIGTTSSLAFCSTAVSSIGTSLRLQLATCRAGRSKLCMGTGSSALRFGRF